MEANNVWAGKPSPYRARFIYLCIQELPGTYYPPGAGPSPVQIYTVTAVTLPRPEAHTGINYSRPSKMNSVPSSSRIGSRHTLPKDRGSLASWRETAVIKHGR